MYGIMLWVLRMIRGDQRCWCRLSGKCSSFFLQIVKTYFPSKKVSKKVSEGSKKDPEKCVIKLISPHHLLNPPHSK